MSKTAEKPRRILSSGFVKMKVKAIANRIDALLVVGAPNSSNSKRLVEVGVKNGTARGLLVQRASELDWSTLQAVPYTHLTLPTIYSV